MLFVRLGDMYGFINSSGQIILPLIYSGFDDFSDGYAVVYKKAREKMLIDTKGKQVLNLTCYDEIKKLTEGLLAVCKNDLWAILI
ncbi:MAG: WG repeat-containing protein [Tannerellaceae bacterium]|nr:WG repeat-containing protein [Tannerellaceae bacterium]